MVDKVLKPFLPSVPILNPLKTSENLGFLMFLGRYKVGTLARNGSGRLCQLFYTWLFDPFFSSHCITKNVIFSHLYASVNCFINDYLTPSSRAPICLSSFHINFTSGNFFHITFHETSQWILFRSHWLSHKLLTVFFVEHLQTAATVMTLPSSVTYTPYESLGVECFKFLISTEIFCKTVDMIIQPSTFASKDYFLILNLCLNHMQQSLRRSTFFQNILNVYRKCSHTYFQVTFFGIGMLSIFVWFSK